MNVPLTRWPVPNELGSATLRSALPADEVTLAVVVAKYVSLTPALKDPNVAAGPSVSDSVAGTLPPTVPSVLVEYVAGGGPEAGGVAGRGRCRYVSASFSAAERSARGEMPSRPKPQSMVSSVAMPGPSAKPTAPRATHAASFSVPAGCGPATNGASPDSKPLDSLTTPSLRICSRSRNTPRPADAKSCA